MPVVSDNDDEESGEDGNELHNLSVNKFALVSCLCQLPSCTCVFPAVSFSLRHFGHLSCHNSVEMCRNSNSIH